MPRGKDYTTTELAEIKSLLKDGLNYNEVAELMGRTKKSITNLVVRQGWTHGRFKESSDAVVPAWNKSVTETTPEPVAPVKEKTLDDFSFRQIIKHLWDKGYRWENMYCIVKQKVNVEDIIKND